MKDFEDIFEGEAEPTIRLRFAGDGRQTSKKFGTVMAVFSVLQEGKHKPNYQYTAYLYNGKLQRFLFRFNNWTTSSYTVIEKK